MEKVYNNNRDVSYDVLRWIALTGMIVVHTEPGEFVTQLRNFDVPLMVVVSAICFGNSCTINEKDFRYVDYIKKRFIRLVLPSWVFLTFYFSISYFTGLGVNVDKIYMCYTLTTDWYFWIIRILVVMAIFAPFLLKYTKTMSDKKLLFVCFSLFIVDELLGRLSRNYLFNISVMCLPYLGYYILGINISRFSNRKITYAGITLLLLYLLLAVALYFYKGEYTPTQRYKYPPMFYYTCYALGISAFLYIYRFKIVIFLRKIGLLRFTTFIGSHTFWIYLWHIPMVEYMALHYPPYLAFVVVYFTATIITYLQTRIVEGLSKHIGNNIMRKQIRMILIG